MATPTTMSRKTPRPSFPSPLLAAAAAVTAGLLFAAGVHAQDPESVEAAENAAEAIEADVVEAAENAEAGVDAAAAEGDSVVRQAEQNAQSAAQRAGGGSPVDVDVDAGSTSGDAGGQAQGSDLLPVGANDVLKFVEYDNGFFQFGAADVEGIADFDVQLRAGLLGQTRAVFSVYDSATNNDDEDIDFGFENTRVSPFVFGRIGSDEGEGFLKGPVEFRVQADFDVDGGELILEDFFIVVPVLDSAALRVGQFLTPYSLEGTTFAGYNLGVSGSLAGLFFAGSNSRLQGISIVETLPNLPDFRAEVALTDGDGSANTTFREGDDEGEGSANFAVAGRGEYKLAGRWADYDDFTAIGTEEQLLVAGAGAQIEFDGDTSTIGLTGDFRYETADGLNGTAGAYTEFGQFDGDDFFGFGAFVQGGYVVGDRLEPYGRFSFIAVDDDVTVTDDEFFFELTGGANYYLLPDDPHRVKLTGDVGFLPLGVPVDLPRGDYVGSEEFQFVIRAQLQFLF